MFTVGKGKGGSYAWFDADEEVGFERGRFLPHWRQDGSLYFVTFRLFDSLPAGRLAEWRRERDEWLAHKPTPLPPADRKEFHRLLTVRWHAMLDEPHGSCLLKHQEARASLEATMRFLDGASKGGYALDEFVIMPNHVHVLVAPGPNVSLKKTINTWKRVSGHGINEVLQRSGEVWQEEPWDHIVRSLEDMERFRRYIRANPMALPGRAE